MKLTDVRYLASEMVSPSWIDIFPQAIMMVVLIAGDPITFVVRDKTLADSFREYFDIMWKNSVS